MSIPKNCQERPLSKAGVPDETAVQVLQLAAGAYFPQGEDKSLMDATVRDLALGKVEGDMLEATFSHTRKKYNCNLINNRGEQEGTVWLLASQIHNTSELDEQPAAINSSLPLDTCYLLAQSGNDACAAH